jgi:PAS domain-containing protein
MVKDGKDHKCILLNRAGEQLMGRDRTEIVGKTAHDWMPEEDAAVLGATDLVRTAALLNRTVPAVKYRRYCLDRGQAKAADRMRKPARKKKR